MTDVDLIREARLEGFTLSNAGASPKIKNLLYNLAAALEERGAQKARQHAATQFWMGRALAAEADARRYRWLRDTAGDEWEVTVELNNGMTLLLRTSGMLDEKIDAALARPTATGGVS